MMIGVVLLVGYMMFSNKRVSSTSSYSKQMKIVFFVFEPSLILSNLSETITLKSLVTLSLEPLLVFKALSLVATLLHRVRSQGSPFVESSLCSTYASPSMSVNFWEHAEEFLEEFGGSLSGVRA
ncbi:hypothetical protein Q3G72_000184 [Acer saccharum]|nr:hypothetical protein Q3G72_000184 [Acer saccharum]